MNGFMIALIGLGLFFAFALVLAIATALTGHDRRAYSVLAPHDSVTVAGRAWQVADLAEKYCPIMHLRKETPSPPLLWVWYEAVVEGQGLDLTYYFAWEDEIHPNPTVHKLYSFFRAIYYGYPVRDIEYIQIRVSIDNGAVSGVQYETSPGDDYFVTVSDHIVARYTLRPDGFFEEVRSTRSGKVLARAARQVPIAESHVLALAQTWNHLSCFVPPDSSELEALEAPLKPLTADEYSRYKFVRKSQGDHRTRENRLTHALALIATGVLVYLPVGAVLLIKRLFSPATKHMEGSHG